LLDEWCNVHERYCCSVPGDAIFWYGERSNVGALAAAASRKDWITLEEFEQDKIVRRCEANGRGDLFLKGPASEEYIESKQVWCRDGSPHRTERVVENIKKACRDARCLSIEEDVDGPRVGVVFAIASHRKSEDIPPDFLHGLIETVSDRLDAAAWCFPSLSHELVSEGRNYLGVLLLAKAVSRSVGS
jgi:hypothetical protein